MFFLSGDKDIPNGNEPTATETPAGVKKCPSGRLVLDNIVVAGRSGDFTTGAEQLNRSSEKQKADNTLIVAGIWEK